MFDERAEKKSGNEGPILPVRRANQSTGFRFILPAREYNHIIRIFYFKGAVSRNSAKLGNYKMPVKLRET